MRSSCLCCLLEERCDEIVEAVRRGGRAAGRGSVHADEADVALSKADDAVGEQHIIRADRRVALCCGVSRRVVAVFAELVAQIALRDLDIAELRGRALYDISAAVRKLRNEVRDSVGVCHGRVRQSARHARGQGVDLLLERGDLRGKRLLVLTQRVDLAVQLLDFAAARHKQDEEQQGDHEERENCAAERRTVVRAAFASCRALHFSCRASGGRSPCGCRGAGRGLGEARPGRPGYRPARSCAASPGAKSG